MMMIRRLTDNDGDDDGDSDDRNDGDDDDDADYKMMIMLWCRRSIFHLALYILIYVDFHHVLYIL